MMPCFNKSPVAPPINATLGGWGLYSWFDSNWTEMSDRFSRSLLTSLCLAVTHTDPYRPWRECHVTEWFVENLRRKNEKIKMKVESSPPPSLTCRTSGRTKCRDFVKRPLESGSGLQKGFFMLMWAELTTVDEGAECGGVLPHLVRALFSILSCSFFCFCRCLLTRTSQIPLIRDRS